MSEPETIAIFRKWRGRAHATSGDSGIIALFPFVPFDYSGRYCTSFEHVGQHGGADYAGCIQRTRPAKPEEYASLKRELETAYGYRLRVLRRKPRRA